MNLPPPPDGTVSQLFPLAFQLSCLWAFVSRHRGVQRYASSRNSLPFHVYVLSVSLFCLLCVSFWTVLLAQTWGKCWLFGVFFFLVTLYSWTTPFCSSSGGGCQETMMAVPLSPLSVTVTLRGGALGAGEVDKRKKMFIYDRGKKKPKCLQSLPAFSVQFSCQNFFCAWLKLMCEQMTNYQIYKHFFLIWNITLLNVSVFWGG